MKYILISLVFVSLVSCNKKKHFDGPNAYFDDFESYNHIDETVDGNNELWSFFQLTYGNNDVSIDSAITHSGNRSVRCFAQAPEDDGTSKASINKQFMAFWEGETVQSDFWLYIEGNDPIDWLFIFDLEEKTPIGAGPGMRLAIVENKILLEHKYNNPNVYQNGEGILFPRNQWVNIRFETKLSRKKKGTVRVWQDGVEIISINKWQTLPKDILYSQQGTKGMYSQIEFGATANSDDNNIVLYVDDVDVKVVE